MKKILLAIIPVLLLSAFIYNNPVSDKVFKQLHALEGKWIMKTKKGFIGEEWVKINDDYLQNRGFYVKGTDTVVTERVSLKKTTEGIFYTSTVEDQNNQQPIAFKMTRSENNMYFFQNPAHDFPKRIVYHLISMDSLHAFIDDGVDGSKKRQDFYYKRQ